LLAGTVVCVHVVRCRSECLRIVIDRDDGVGQSHAEGVEMEAQAELARQAGVTDIQGFLISKAIPADDVASWITAYDAGPTERRTSLES